MRKRIRVRVLVAALVVGFLTAEAPRAYSQGIVAAVHFDSNQTNPLVVLVEHVGAAIIYNNLARYYPNRYWLTGDNARRRRFLDALEIAVQNNTNVDVVVSTHGWKDYIALDNSERLTGRDLRNFGQDVSRSDRLRLVYQGNCHGDSLYDDWLQAGADSVLGARAVVVSHPLELPSMTYELGTRRRNVSDARGISWRASGWLELLFPTWNGHEVDGYKLVRGRRDTRVR